MTKIRVKRDALFFGERNQFRVWLTREWDKTKPSITFVMRNPRAAGADENDLSIQRCIDFARDWGFGELIVVNLFDFRTNDPQELLTRIEKRKRTSVLEYEEDVERLLATSDRIVVAWGVIHPKLQWRVNRIMPRLFQHQKNIYALDVTNGGHPKHPLSVSRYCEPILYASKSN